MRSKKFLFGIIVIFVIIAVAAIAVMQIKESPWPDKQLIANKYSVEYPLYYPSKLPKGFSYTNNSLKPSEVATIYSLTYQKDKKVYISNQPIPKQVVFKDFYDRLLKNKADITSDQGKAVTGIIAGQSVGSLVSDKTWVIINAPSGIDNEDLSRLVSSLKKLP